MIHSFVCHTTYRTLLRSSSNMEPSHPLYRVFEIIRFLGLFFVFFSNIVLFQEMCKNDSQFFRKSKKITQKRHEAFFGFFVNDPSAGSPTSES
jgi:hypothetical protein